MSFQWTTSLDVDIVLFEFLYRFVVCMIDKNFWLFIVYCGGILLPSTCEINYVNMQHNYVDIRFIYVNMQHHYVYVKHNYVNKSHVNIMMLHVIILHKGTDVCHHSIHKCIQNKSIVLPGPWYYAINWV